MSLSLRLLDAALGEVEVGNNVLLLGAQLGERVARLQRRTLHRQQRLLRPLQVRLRGVVRAQLGLERELVVLGVDKRAERIVVDGGDEADKELLEGAGSRVNICFVYS